MRRGPGHDPDDDYLPNLLEYAFQMNPSTGQSGAAALPEFAVNEDGTVTMTYCQIDAPTEGSANTGFRVQDLIYIPQISFGDRTAAGEFIWIGGEGDGEVFEDAPAVERFDGKGLVRVALKSREPLGNSSQQMFGRILVRLNE